MSIFSSNNWPPSCSSAKQSPINLTQSGAKPCRLSCDLVMDDGNVSQANVSVSNEGLILESPSSLGSCKFRGESYVCQGLAINHPSHHTIEGVQADGEVTAFFRKPTGELLCMSSLFRINSAQTPSYNFFKQIVPYAITTGETKLTLREWSIAQIVPPESSYYVYDGSSLVPPCTPCEWVVFKSMINMDQGDFSYLVRNVEAGSRPVQGLGDREVFFNDINNIPGGPVPHDNKFYLRLRPTGNTKVGGKLEVKKADLKNNVKQSEADKKQQESDIQKWWNSMSDWQKAGFVIGMICVIPAVYYGWSTGSKTPITGEYGKTAAVKIRGWIFGLYNWIINLFTYAIQPVPDSSPT